MPILTVLPRGLTLTAPAGENLFLFLRSQGLTPDNFCGGNGKCGKCKVLIDGREALSCETAIDRDMTVTLFGMLPGAIRGAGSGDTGTLLQPATPEGPAEFCPSDTCALAFDIGTTTLVATLLLPGGATFTRSLLNPGTAYGADVISRVQAARKGAAGALSDAVRDLMQTLTAELCAEAGIAPEEIRSLSLVGNPAMQQLLLGLPLENLIRPPFVGLPYSELRDAAGRFGLLPGARLLTLPQISGYVGADTLACLLATRMAEAEELSLLVDIGTNGEIVLGSRDGLLCTATAAGPALEGAGISCGMRATEGAIRHVRADGSCEVIGGGQALGLCGSGIIDACAFFFRNGLINERGRANGSLALQDGIALTQDDIRAVQTAKGAIAAGIRLLARRRGIALRKIRRVYLAGAFGTAIDPESACDIGLLPEELRGRIIPVGNAALRGAELLTAGTVTPDAAQDIARKTVFHDLAADPDFELTFALSMYFPGNAEDEYE